MLPMVTMTSQFVQPAPLAVCLARRDVGGIVVGRPQGTASD